MDLTPPPQDNPLYNLPPKKKVLQPLPEQLPAKNKHGSVAAVDLIRHKIDSLYGEEPSARQELTEAEHDGPHHSKHQKFMLELSSSGKSLAEIQTAWHNYYTSLPDDEKHAVWQEFYEQAASTSKHPGNARPAEPEAKPEPQPVKPIVTPHKRERSQEDRASLSEIKQHLIGKVQSRKLAEQKRGTHLRSLLFGLSMGGITLLFLLFGFFNERLIAPFITPSRAVSDTPIITDVNTAVGPEPKIIIPKINVEIPVIYDEPSIQEAAVQKALERGVVHYATTPGPGELGNGVIFGHSSNNILNKGQYKFAFVLLSRLESGDTFMVQKDGKRYVYKVYEKKVVKPSEVGVLGPTEKPATFTLITCDPPGTAINRLVVIGEQVSPDPGANVASSAVQSAAVEPATLPSNAPSLWQRLTDWLTG